MIRPPNRAFEYPLNAMDRAAHESEPAKHGYADKRKAVFAYVAHLESLAEARGRAVDAANVLFSELRVDHLGIADALPHFKTAQAYRAALAAIPKE